jgi:GTP-binding protein
MKISHSEFISSYDDVQKCPPPDKPEFAFIGRSNVGKSSLINMLTNSKKLAKISDTPGKTQTINHYLVNHAWYLVDLPGYGYASVSKSKRATFGHMIESYVLRRENLGCLFILIDSRHAPQGNDIDFIRFAGTNQVPLALVFTKLDKLKQQEITRNLDTYRNALLKEWEVLPPILLTSVVTGIGRDELLAFIDDAILKMQTSK